ncbi:unnamed protein product, partial [Mesorhabditis belari]|uniref:Uncharacterized protein n=1 Tax=Mesorhabditis belari TaxID=2138241 RepID=A0AAF3E8Q9_9BILA
MRLIAVHPSLGSRRLTKIAIDGIYLFLKAHRKSHNKVQIWKVNTLVPSDWECIFELQLKELIYSIPAYDYKEKVIFLLVAAVFENEENFRITLFRIDDEKREEWSIIDENGEIWQVPLENVAMGVGGKEMSTNSRPTLHLYDRSIVQGPIPFWYLHLTKTNFYLEKRFLEDIEDVKCHRFAFCLDGDSRRFARLREDNGIAVYDGEAERWVHYEQDADSDFDLHILSAVNDLRETFGRAGRRVAAVESPLTIHTDAGICVAKRVTSNSIHEFYRIDFDHQRRSYSLRSRGAANLKEVATMYYVLVSEELAAVVGLSCVAIIPLQPPPLSHLAVWAVQKETANRDERGALHDGLTYPQIHHLLTNLANLSI